MFFFNCSSTLLALFLRKAGMISSSTFLAYSVKSGKVSIACNNVAQGRTSPQGHGFTGIFFKRLIQQQSEKQD